MDVKGLHHVAYRCSDAKRTTEFYTRYLGLDFNIAVAENYVPSTGEWSPHIHIFFRMDDDSHVAFFEVPESPAMQKDAGTPEWVQHLALRVADMDTLLKRKAQLEADGIAVVGPTDHHLCQSIYFFDPDGHRLELAVDSSTPEMLAQLRTIAEPTLAEWAVTKRAPDVAPIHENARG